MLIGFVLGCCATFIELNSKWILHPKNYYKSREFFDKVEEQIELRRKAQEDLNSAYTVRPETHMESDRRTHD